jgi:hypothetical protein
MCGSGAVEMGRGAEGCHDVAVGHRFDLDSDVEQLIADLCIGMGCCLPPEEIRRLCESPPKTVDSFTDAVFEAEGIGDMSYTDLRRQVREIVARHMSGWPGEGVADR